MGTHSQKGGPTPEIANKIQLFLVSNLEFTNILWYKFRSGEWGVVLVQSATVTTVPRGRATKKKSFLITISYVFLFVDVFFLNNKTIVISQCKRIPNYFFFSSCDTNFLPISIVIQLVVIFFKMGV